MSEHVHADVSPLDRVAFRVNGLAVLDPIEPGHSVLVPAPPMIAARAVEAEPDDAENLYAQEAVESSDTYRPDADRMEHERQSRLMRWQAQP